MSLNSRGVCESHFTGQILSCPYTIGSYGQISIFCTIPRRFPCPPSHLLSYTLSMQIYMYVCVCIRFGLFCFGFFVYIYIYIYIYIYQPLFLQNNNHQAVFLTAWWLLFFKNSMKPRSRSLNSMNYIYIYIYIYIYMHGCVCLYANIYIYIYIYIRVCIHLCNKYRKNNSQHSLCRSRKWKLTLSQSHKKQQWKAFKTLNIFNNLDIATNSSFKNYVSLFINKRNF